MHSIERFFLVIILVPLSHFDLTYGFNRKQVIEVALFRHLIKADYLVDVTNTEAPVCFQDREES